MYCATCGYELEDNYVNMLELQSEIFELDCNVCIEKKIEKGELPYNTINVIQFAPKRKNEHSQSSSIILDKYNIKLPKTIKTVIDCDPPDNFYTKSSKYRAIVRPSDPTIFENVFNSVYDEIGSLNEIVAEEDIDNILKEISKYVEQAISNHKIQIEIDLEDKYVRDVKLISK